LIAKVTIGPQRDIRRLSGGVAVGCVDRVPGRDAAALWARKEVIPVSAALVFTYTRPWPDRETLAMEAFADALTFFGKLAADDKCGEPLLYMSTKGNSMMIVHGEREFLSELIETDDFQAMYLKAAFSVPDIGYEIFGFAETVQETMTRWATKGVELGIMTPS
jgi:hypothetical protein